MKRASLVAAALATAAAAMAPAAHGADPKAECIAAADQGQSLRDDGHYLRARDAFAVCLRDVCPKVIAKSCTRWMRELEDAMPTVALGAKDETGQDLTAAHVTLDGKPLTEVLDGQPVAVDPGPHVLRFEKAGSESAEEHVVLTAGEKNRVVAVTLRSVAAAQATPAPAPPLEGPPSGATTTTKKVVTLSMLVLGAAGIGTGSFLLVQSGKQSSSAASLRTGIPSNACTNDPSSSTCQQLSSAVDAQHRDAAIGATALVAGGALVVGAVVTWLMWPHADSAAASLPVRWIAPGGLAGTF